jgi:HD-like signal output (HDOD) protein
MGGVARRIAEDLEINKGGEALTAGLLHDMGIGIIFKFFPKEFDLIVNDVQNHNIPIKEAQLNHLGYTHQEIGSMVCKNWNLPENLCDAILCHETPSESENDKIVPAVVHLADYLTQKFEVGSFYWDKGLMFDEDVLKLLHFNSLTDLDEFTDSYENLFKQELANIKFV